MKKIALLLAIITGLTGSDLFAQKVINDPNAEKRNVGDFHGIEVGSGIDLYISQGESAVVVSAAEVRYRDLIRTEVKNGVLKIWYDNRSGISFGTSSRRMKAYISYKELDRLKASGGSDIWVNNSIIVSVLDLEVSGGSDFHGKVAAQTLKAEASGGSDIIIEGSVDNLTLVATGGSDFKGYGLSANVCDIVASGGSDVYITVNMEMTAAASGGSDIRYKGAGLIREIKSSGSSGIKRVSK